METGTLDGNRRWQIHSALPRDLQRLLVGTKDKYKVAGGISEVSMNVDLCS